MRQLIFLLKSDLERAYTLEGCIKRRATLAGVAWRFRDPRYAPVALCRIARALFLARCVLLARIVGALNFMLFGLEVSLRCEIGPGLYMPHTSGTVIGAANIGSNVTIYHQVTLGAKTLDIKYDSSTRPQIGNWVVIGSGAKVLGGIMVGDNAVIGANAVVLKSVTSGCRACGVPAKETKI